MGWNSFLITRDGDLAPVIRLERLQEILFGKIEKALTWSLHLSWSRFNVPITFFETAELYISGVQEFDQQTK